MKQLFVCVDILIMAPFYLGYLWAADKFCKKFLGTSKRREWLFLGVSFCGWLLRNILGSQFQSSLSGYQQLSSHKSEQ